MNIIDRFNLRVKRRGLRKEIRWRMGQLEQLHEDLEGARLLRPIIEREINNIEEKIRQLEEQIEEITETLKS